MSLCLGFATRDAPRKAQHQRRMAIVKRGERARVAIRDRANEGFVDAASSGEE